MSDQFSLDFKTALSALSGPDSKNPHYNILFKRGSAELLVYSPKDVDDQEIHDQDEFYFIVSGSGSFFDGKTVKPVKAGDAIFIAAGVEHRFLNFTDDLSMWVLFYGPIGGEAKA